MADIHRIEFALQSRSDWVKVFDPRDCTLFLAVASPPAVGTRVRVDLAVGPNGPRVILRGKVISRRDGAGQTGCSVALGAREREKINYLNGFVRGGLLNLRERRRLPLRLAVTYGGVRGPIESYTRDINEEGVFVVSDDPLPEDSEVHLLIAVPGHDRPLSVTGIVTHTVVVEDEDVPGMGIVFNNHDRAPIVSAIDALERAFLSGQLPDDALI